MYLFPEVRGFGSTVAFKLCRGPEVIDGTFFNFAVYLQPGDSNSITATS
jgi:hypothetical protein